MTGEEYGIFEKKGGMKLLSEWENELAREMWLEFEEVLYLT